MISISGLEQQPVASRVHKVTFTEASGQVSGNDLDAIVALMKEHSQGPDAPIVKVRAATELRDLLETNRVRLFLVKEHGTGRVVGYRMMGGPRDNDRDWNEYGFFRAPDGSVPTRLMELLRRGSYTYPVQAAISSEYHGTGLARAFSDFVYERYATDKLYVTHVRLFSEEQLEAVGGLSGITAAHGNVACLKHLERHGALALGFTSSIPALHTDVAVGRDGPRGKAGALIVVNPPDWLRASGAGVAPSRAFESVKARAYCIPKSNDAGVPAILRGADRYVQAAEAARESAYEALIANLKAYARGVVTDDSGDVDRAFQADDEWERTRNYVL
ncbi:MAG: hypothetical protein AAFX94_10265, partial [Myxococcota bacterium]